MVRQFIRSAIRDCAVWMIGALWPSSSPATTTAMTPEPWMRWYSAATYAANGTTIEMPVSRIGSVTWRRTHATTRKTTKPTRAPPPAARTKSSVTSRASTPTAVAARAVRSATRAVASLSSDSPSRIVTIRRGSPIRRPTAVAATASGGATTAPIASATGQDTSITACTRAPTPTVVKTTSPTLSNRIGRRLALKSTSDVCTAVA